VMRKLLVLAFGILRSGRRFDRKTVSLPQR
jgi:hypothetical protein